MAISVAIYGLGAAFFLPATPRDERVRREDTLTSVRSRSSAAS